MLAARNCLLLRMNIHTLPTRIELSRQLSTQVNLYASTVLRMPSSQNTEPLLAAAIFAINLLHLRIDRIFLRTYAIYILIVRACVAALCVLLLCAPS